VRRDTLSFGASVNRIKCTQNSIIVGVPCCGYVRHTYDLLCVALVALVALRLSAGWTPSRGRLNDMAVAEVRAPPSPGRCPRKCGPIPASDTQQMWGHPAMVFQGPPAIKVVVSPKFSKCTPYIVLCDLPNPPRNPSTAITPPYIRFEPKFGRGL